MSLSAVEVVALATGAIAVMVAVAWRARAHRRSREVLRAALADPDPAARRSAIQIVSQMGLARHGETLLQVLRDEQDPEVLDALAQAIGRNQWEPADQPTVFELRVWAQRRLEASAARSTTRQAVGAATRRPSAPVVEDCRPVITAQVVEDSIAGAPAAEATIPPPNTQPADRRPSKATAAVEVFRPTPVAVARPLLPGHRIDERADVTPFRWLMVVALWLVVRVYARRRQDGRTSWA